MDCTIELMFMHNYRYWIFETQQLSCKRNNLRSYTSYSFKKE